ncbi:response regulator transcription factor [Acetatifactor muris]|uniref:Stage 0 sporulation protein A homolog n=1 Tax=Acetatifactor muris TaxID=879566 RepID=A0A2K4ZCB3_9FIRM|nr:response regulator transcription factor [Acetatifactor muris]MCI8799776.1 response regulator transcription factor [Lachnospiraceae bacterium]MCR2046335.1 response regulator transcription factor [Acetatifactor muris]SOY28097.1 KDP operon transcriptional regulatory protein KdpE [Acetatifactor muris]
MEKNILVYNNQTGIAEKMVPLCTGEGIAVLVAANVQQLFEILDQAEIHLMLVDVELNDKGWDKGIEMIASLRRRSSIPLMVISAQSAETAKIMALEAGADDYVTADCNPLEILARIKSQLRRYTQLVNMCANIDRIYRVDDLVIDDTQRKVTVEGRNVRLTPIEYKILRLLVQKKGKVFSNSQIYENIWHMQAIGADNTIAVHVRHIREKIEKNPREPRYLKVVWGNGYKVG